MAATPPNIPGHEDYMNADGVLAADTYILYPWEEKNLYIGFSKYGELIDGNDTIGLMYDGVDVFANPAVPMNKWSNGWVMDIHYVDQGHLKNIWAYALFSDLWSGPSPPATEAIGGNWRNMQQSKDASAPGDTHGGRRTNGYAETDDIRLIYDGPRKSIYLLRTRIYDKAPPDNQALVELTIQLVFNKVKKYVMEIKDIKRIDENKMTTPFQIEFSQRGQWDLGDETNSFSYAEFYNDLETKYNKHPFYTVDSSEAWMQEHEVTYDLCQIIADDEDLVGFAAYWPTLISKWVDNTDLPLSRVGQDDLPNYLTTMETKEQEIEVLDQGDLVQNQWYYYYKWNLDNTLSLRIPDEVLVEYPRGAGEWSAAPWVFRWDEDIGDWMVVIDDDWIWDDVLNHVIIDDGSWEPGDMFLLVFKREMMGHVPHEPIPMPCCEDMFEHLPVESYGMYAEPRVPYVFAEWDFDLDWIEPDKSSHQFRCVSIHGITDNNDAVDPDMDGNNFFKIDEEVKYQLNEIFNPWDLKDAAHKDTFRWCQKDAMADTITLKAHLYDKYGNERLCLLGKHEVLFPMKWGEYCMDSEKVIVYDSTGTNEAKLLMREEDYTASIDTIMITTDLTGYDYYKVLYSTTLTGDGQLHDGRWEWLVIGEESLASDSIGSAMMSATWADWKNKETWLSGLDVEAEIFGPAIPYVLRPFDGDFRMDDGRIAFKDDWSTPDDWDMTWINPYAISSSNVMVVGGPIVNLAAEYYNDFTDAFVYSEYGEGFYAPGCWSRTIGLPDKPVDELWYESTVIDDDVGYAIISTYKDLNETVGFIVYGYTAEDTYYASYFLRGGGLAWLQEFQKGVTTIVLRIDYGTLHPVGFHVEEFLGQFTECSGAGTNFKDGIYDGNVAASTLEIEQEAYELGLCYKLVDVEFCAEVHPDP
ncbi:hypothetical protein JXL21_09620 [Candidatus Bathyarchaeota archaeon]|nr:hypothetical protein [Candidatus Bathyarchaeota archaeon]